MTEDIAVVVTSVSQPNKVMAELAEGCKRNGYRFIVIGDKTSPGDFHIDGCDYFSIDDQLASGFKLAEMCPLRHYARKNIGYLIAVKNGAEIIIETDDDNMPYDSFWLRPQCSMETKVITNAGWVNIYNYFTDQRIWPRGFPLEYIRKETPSFDRLNSGRMNCLIQQGLVDENPDVDSIYRLVMPLPQSFKKDRQVILARDTWCPVNSQNTTWWRDTFELLYLPAYCTFRMTDIWRGFIAQRIAHINGWGILYNRPTVWQERNEHKLIQDFKDEVPGYLNNAEICSDIERLDLKPGIDKIADNLRLYYRKLVEKGLVHSEELKLLDVWLSCVRELLDNQ